jgi:hypothetical protein
MTTKIKELIDQLTNNITTQNDILEILDVVDAKTCNIVAQCLIPQIKSRVEMLTSNVKAFIEMLTDYDTNNDVDPSKFTYDVMYPDGRIEIGLHSPSKEKLLELLSICTSSKDIQILRVIDSNGKIIESNKPHFTDACFKSGFGNSIYNPITDSRLIEEFTKKELTENVHDMDNQQLSSRTPNKELETQLMMEFNKIDQKLFNDKFLKKDTCFDGVHSTDELKEEIERYTDKSLPKNDKDLNNLKDKKTTTKQKSSKKNKKNKKK